MAGREREMRLAKVFSNSFLDGFTMAGFLPRLGQPGAATRLMAPPVDLQREDSDRLTLLIFWQKMRGTLDSQEISAPKDLGDIPQSVLQSMIELLKTEEGRRTPGQNSGSDKAAHGAAR